MQTNVGPTGGWQAPWASSGSDWFLTFFALLVLFGASIVAILIVHFLHKRNRGLRKQ